VLDVATLGLLERDLAQEGLSQMEIRNLLHDLHLQVLGDSLAALSQAPSGSHPVRTLMEEHRAMLAALNALDEVVRRLETAPSLESIRERGRDHGQLEGLRRVAGLLQEAESHHRRRRR